MVLHLFSAPTQACAEILNHGNEARGFAHLLLDISQLTISSQFLDLFMFLLSRSSLQPFWTRDFAEPPVLTADPTAIGLTDTTPSTSSHVSHTKPSTHLTDIPRQWNLYGDHGCGAVDHISGPHLNPSPRGTGAAASEMQG